MPLELETWPTRELQPQLGEHRAENYAELLFSELLGSSKNARWTADRFFACISCDWKKFDR